MGAIVCLLFESWLSVIETEVACKSIEGPQDAAESLVHVQVHAFKSCVAPFIVGKTV